MVQYFEMYGMALLLNPCVRIVQSVKLSLPLVNTKCVRDKATCNMVEMYGW